MDEYKPKYTQEYFDECEHKLDKLDKLLAPYDELFLQLRELNVLFEAYKCCGTEIDYMPDVMKVVDKMWDIVADARLEIWRKQDPLRDELMNI